MYHVYWIRYPHHTDVAHQGYVGVTNNFQRRMYGHWCSSNRQVDHALRNGAIYSIIHSYESEECAYLHELFLRPDWNRAWNYNPGGKRFPQHERTPEIHAKISAALKRSHARRAADKKAP